ncbi:uncharacterized protein B0H64DRAFT_398675 [Chaetomium fimeti]|uniref:Uncharacterized protein n=1 Tax=Chaetomium fimeti TaxID=1854472 RepID=A0AAE0LQQ8_9PEZI|nr:hypothetical protein B0H64DRAFT_398675 [Chaetomium fimeti]
MYHASEADVVRAAGIYLMHPVGQALNFHQNLARSITIQSEFQKSRMRTDIAYFKSPNRQGNPGRAFAVIEFKKRGVLSNAQFAAATKPVDTTNPAQVKQAVDAAMKRPPVGGDRSFFERSSLKCIKQVAAYALNNKIQYAALFDWDVLVLVRFSQHNIGPQPGNVNPSVGNWCELTVFTTAESHLMRPALLGFLAEAYVKTPY